MEKGDRVIVNLGFKIVQGVVVENNADSKYITVKHDNFAGEVFEKSQVTKIYAK